MTDIGVAGLSQFATDAHNADDNLIRLGKVSLERAKQVLGRLQHFGKRLFQTSCTNNTF